MAAFAGLRCRNVVLGLAESRSPIVTGGATIGDPGMIHLGCERKTRRARMARIARCRGDEVICRLSESDRAVVAIAAWRGGLSMIDQPNVTPKGGLVTPLAYLRRLLMALRLPACHSAIVATKALSRRRFEATADMTRLAADRRVASRKGKSR